jgi:hypothetical protein
VDEHSQKMQRIGAFRLHGEQPFIQLPRLSKIHPPLKPDGRLDHFPDGAFLWLRSRFSSHAGEKPADGEG